MPVTKTYRPASDTFPLGSDARYLSLVNPGEYLTCVITRIDPEGYTITGRDPYGSDIVFTWDKSSRYFRTANGMRLTGYALPDIMWKKDTR